jgi:hypothetical protein
MTACDCKTVKNAFIHLTSTLSTLSQRSTNVPKIQGSLPNFGCWKDELMHVPYLWLEWCLNLTVIWWFVHGAHELILLFECTRKAVIIMLKMLDTTVQNVFNHLARRLGFVHPCRRCSFPELEFSLTGLEFGHACGNTGNVTTNHSMSWCQMRICRSEFLRVIWKCG